MTKKFFLSKCSSPELFRAVINQFGGWARFKDVASDVANYGISGGFGGFIYYADTVKFAKKNQNLIIASLNDMAEQLEEDVAEMVFNFGYFRRDKADRMEIYRFLGGIMGKDDTKIPNMMAWYAAEECCREFVDME